MTIFMKQEFLLWGNNFILRVQMGEILGEELFNLMNLDALIF